MKIAYIMSRFPLLSETFILREMIEVERQGVEICLYPLICMKEPVVHKETLRWTRAANCIPFLSTQILAENIRALIQKPPVYVSLLWQVIKENLTSPDFLIRGLMLFPKAVYMAKQLSLENIEHIHAHYATHPGLVAWVIHKLTGISYSITIHSHDIYDCQAMLETKLRGAKFLVPISNYNVDYMAKMFGEWIREKCHVVHCGIDVSNYSVQQEAPLQGERDFDLIQIGSLNWKKGQTYLIQAIALLRARGIPVRLRIIGEGADRAVVEEEIKKNQLAAVVELLGAKTQEEVAALLVTADCYVQSSVSEGIPIALMEALACELPVIATNITGIPELVLNNKTGILVPPANAEALADAIGFMRADFQKGKNMGKAGRIWVQEQFNLENNISRLVALFRQYTNTDRQ
jgi:glycosyltransferase involved in cell wall biosynthesis